MAKAPEKENGYAREILVMVDGNIYWPAPMVAHMSGNKKKTVDHWVATGRLKPAMVLNGWRLFDQDEASAFLDKHFSDEMRLVYAALENPALLESLERQLADPDLAIKKRETVTSMLTRARGLRTVKALQAITVKPTV